MKKTFLTLLILLTTATLWAQAPQRMSYQAIIRDGNNVLVASTSVGVKISLIQGTANGSVVYAETHNKATNTNGLLSLEIGEGTILSGTFAGIDWANGPYLIKTETDPTGGTDYSIPGIAALNSVPYALFSANGTPGLQGPLGLTGLTGPAGAAGSNGLDGTNGTNGTNGANGSNGLDGKTVLNGAINPDTHGVEGDFYINTATSMLFGPKASGGWPTGVSLVGTTGVQGPQGSQGVIGANGTAGSNGLDGTNGANGTAGSNGTNGTNGTNGANGSNGLDGKTVLNGAINPDTQGVEGDFYINTATSMLFGPKASGGWPTGVSLVGTTGIQGPQGLQASQLWEQTNAYVSGSLVHRYNITYFANSDIPANTTFVTGTTDATWSHTRVNQAASTVQAVDGTLNDVYITPQTLREGFNASGFAPVYACRAWVNFDGQPSSPFIRSSGNVRSVESLGTGQYRINFITWMPDANYAPQVTRSGGSNASAPRISDLNRGSFIVHIDRDSQYQLSEICSIVVFR